MCVQLFPCYWLLQRLPGTTEHVNLWDCNYEVRLMLCTQQSYISWSCSLEEMKKMAKRAQSERLSDII